MSPGVTAARVGLVTLLVVVVSATGVLVLRLPSQQGTAGSASTTEGSTASGADSTTTAIQVESTGGNMTTSATSSMTSQQTTTTSYDGISCPGEPGFSYSSVNITFTVPRCTSYTFPSSASQIAALNSSQVFPYVNGAYYYDVAFVDGSFASTADVVLNVTGSLEVTGNWTTSYNVSFVGNRLLNITIEREQSTYVVTNLSVDRLPDRSHSLTFDQQQQKVIQVALSNRTVIGLMTDPPYYVNLANTPGLSLNESNYIQLQQVNGIRVINVGVNNNVTTVVSAGASTRAGVSCDNDGVCITDPWDVHPLSGVSEPPFLLTISYPGEWSAYMTVYNNTYPSPRALLYAKTFTGAGNDSITIPWQSTLGGMEVTAVVQKSDGGNATLTATINWTGLDDPDTKSTYSGGPSVTVSSSVLTG